MSNNPNIRAANFFFIRWITYKFGAVPQVLLDEYAPCYHPAVDDAEPVLMTPQNATIEQALSATHSRDVDKPVLLAHTDGQAPESDPDTPTHVLIGLRNVGGNIDEVAMQIAAAEGRPYRHVKLSHAQALSYVNDGNLPS